MDHCVELVEECKISPRSPSLPLTFFDVAWLPMPLMHILFFYEFHHPTSYFIDKLLPNLKHSLSVALKHFYPLAGNLTWLATSALPEIIYNDGDTVPLTVYESLDYENFSFLASDPPRDVNLFYPLIPKFNSRDSDDNKVLPLLAIQVTVFSNKGICVGIGSNHVAADGRSTTHFIKSWASICKSNGNASTISESLPFYDRSTIKEGSPGEILAVLGDLEKIGITRDTFHIPKNVQIVKGARVRATFVLTTSYIRSLKQHISRCHEDVLHLSSLVVTCAYLWVCWTKTKSMKEKDSGENIEYLLIPADMRERLPSPLPLTYFGNCLASVDVMSKRRELLGEDGLATAAKLIGRGIQNIGSTKPKDLSFFLSTPPEQIMSFSNSPKFGVYGTDFGWGKPKKVEIGGDSVSLSECPDNNAGIEIGWVRDKEDMDAFAAMFATSLPTIL